MHRRSYIGTLAAAVCLLGGLTVRAQDAADLRELLQDIELGERWFYNDVEAAFAQARATGKPVLALFR